MNTINIGDKIKQLRKEKGLTQEELAIKCGLSKNAIWNYENNHRQPDIQTLNKIATALGVSIGDLLESNKTLSQKLIDELEYPLIKLFGPTDTLEVLSDELNVDYDLLDNNLNENIDFPENVQISLLKFLSDIDFPLFMKFMEENKSYISKNDNLHSEVNKIMSEKILELEDDTFIAFKNYLMLTFGDKINEFVTEDNLKDLQMETEKFLEFALFKIEKKFYDENEI
ncbi:hypothetical protein UT300018_10390 [Clostridium faecium]